MCRPSQRKIEQFDRTALLGEFCGVFAHEISQPLATCRNYVDTARAALSKTGVPPGAPSEVSDWLEQASRQLDRATATLSKIRELIGGPAGSFSDMAVRDVLEGASSLERERLQEAGIVLKVKIEPSELRAFMDGGRMSLATAQLIRNAIEAIETTPEASRQIGVEAQVADGYVEIRVSDEGCGTSDEVLSRIDEPFFTTKAGALGMGLNVVRSVVHNHGGEVIIRRNHPRGLAVTMRLRRLSAL